MKRAHPLRSFRQSYLRQAQKLPDLRRSGGWALAFSAEKPRLNDSPLFGSSLEELTGAETSTPKPQQHPTRRGGRAEEPPTSPAPRRSGSNVAKAFRREEPREPAPPRALPPEAPAAELARWAGEKVEAVQQPQRRKRESPASGRQAPDPQAVADHRREVATRSRRPLSVTGMPNELSVREESPEARGRAEHAASLETSERGEKKAAGSLGVVSHSRLGAAPDISVREPAPRVPLSSLPRQGGRGNDPWGTLVSGAQAPRTLLDVPTKENVAQRSPKAARPRASSSPFLPIDESPASQPNAANVSPFSHDRSSAPTFDAHEGHPSPFAPIAADPLSPHPTGSPLGPFPNGPTPDRALPDTLQGVPSFSPPEAFSFAPSSSSSDDLSDLASKIERILTDEARRHGIDV